MATIPAVTIDTFRNEYEQIRTPDFAVIASLVNRAKGQARSMAQFAEDTKIGPSTLSRIVNGKSTKPLSKDVIIKIYENRSEMDDVLLLDSLARANGMFPKDFAERVKVSDRFAAKRNEEISRERMMKNSLIAGVAACGIPVSQVVNTPLYRASVVPAYFPRKRGDFVLELAENPDSNIRRTWTFFLFPHIHDEADDERHLSVRQIVRSIFDRINGWFVLDAWGSPALMGDKFSFAFVDEDIFREFIDALQDAKLHTEMTALLMDTQTFAVAKEVWLPGEYEQWTNISIFEMPAPVMNDDNDEFYDDDEE